MPLTVRDIPFFKGLSDGEIKVVGECLKEKTFKKGEVLFLEGGLCEKVFFVRSGRIKLTRVSSAGREQVLQTLGPGDTCACNPGSSVWHCASTSVALTTCTVWYLSRERYAKLVQSSSNASRALNRLFAERLQCFSALIEEVSLKDSRKRLVRFLLDMCQAGNGTVPFTQEELAQRIGAARETVARQLHQLRTAKLIEVHRGGVSILDRARLEKLL